jgi:hypothetical protein
MLCNIKSSFLFFRHIHCIVLGLHYENKCVDFAMDAFCNSVRTGPTAT